MLLVTGGMDSSALRSVEVLSADGSPLPCSLPDLPTARVYHTQDGQVACGGWGGNTREDSCVALTAAGWEEAHNLQQQRRTHSSWRSPAGLLLMGGWRNATSTELLSNTDSSSSYGFTTLYNTQ